MKEKWFEPKVHSGWHKTQSPRYRRRLALKSHKGDKLATARSLNALASVTQDNSTKLAARRDAKYFFTQHKKEMRFVD